MENIYGSIAARTGGNIYIGVVGPVRTGKSTFIRNFMETMVLPNMENIYVRERARDELPQCGSGKTIMTAEPKFVPEEAASLVVDGSTKLNIRLIDCVGYMVEGAAGQMDGENPRMVMTPWFDHEVSLAEAAELGTGKVITEHSTIGIVVTTDGSFTELERSAYAGAEERIIAELKAISKPFCILLNTADPSSEDARKLARSLEEKYGVSCMAANCREMGREEMEKLLGACLYEFPVRQFDFELPGWVCGLPEDDPLLGGIYRTLLDTFAPVDKMKKVQSALPLLSAGENISRAFQESIEPGEGLVKIRIEMPDELYYAMLSRETGLDISSQAQVLPMMRELARQSREYSRIEGALEQVRQTGYGIVMPVMDELHLEQPEIVKQGGRFGVKLRASAPSIHMIRADIETEVSPVVGSERQSEDLVRYLLSEFEDSPERLWQTNIFGKSLSELVNEGLLTKLAHMPEDARSRLQETLERVINEGCGGLICIIL